MKETPRGACPHAPSGLPHRADDLRVLLTKMVMAHPKQIS
jgi:hypothetical protein